MSEIDNKYSKLGGANSFLGKPTSEETTCPDGVGRYRHYEHGSIYWHPFTGAHEVHGLIRGKWAKLGWEKSVLGYPKTDESSCPVGNGKYNLFQGGTILWYPPSKEAFEVHGAIRSKWGSLGWESGFLGFPTTDESKTPDGMGRYNHFQNGSIYWKPSLSAHEVHGLIRKYWADNGWEKNSALGYPLSDELPTSPGSKNRFSDFENGVLYWKSGESQAVPLEKFVFGDKASQAASDIVGKLATEIKNILQKNSEVYIKGGPKLSEVADYSFDGDTVHNRRYKMHVDFGIDVSTLPDPTVNMDLWVGIDYIKESRSVVAMLVETKWHVHVPFPTSVGLKAKDVSAELHKAIDPEMFVPRVQGIVPEAVNVLSVKVMLNGDLNVYKEP